LDVELSRALDGAPVFTIFEYGETVSGYALARGGVLVDRYISDPTWLNDQEESIAPDLESLRGHPERFTDLLPPDTAPEDFARIVLMPGWWEEYIASTGENTDEGHPLQESGEDAGVVDERDRMRCIALALELWGPSDYPLTQDTDDIENKTVGPGIILAFN
jgi:hypothetical protein